MTSDEIRKVTFEKKMSGYRPEDVDDFLQQVAKEVDGLNAQLQEANAAKDQAEAKMYILAEKVEEYRGQEDTLKTTLINAQRLGESVVHEAKQKAEAMIRDATGKAELLRQQAEQEILAEQGTLEKMQDEVSRFKATILNLYKQHIESLSALDAPAEHVTEFLEENRREVPGEELPQPADPVYEAEEADEAMAGDTEPVPAAPDEASNAFAGATQTYTSQSSRFELFEGMPIDTIDTEE